MQIRHVSPYSSSHLRFPMFLDSLAWVYDLYRNSLAAILSIIYNKFIWGNTLAFKKFIFPANNVLLKIHILLFKQTYFQLLNFPDIFFSIKHGFFFCYAGPHSKRVPSHIWCIAHASLTQIGLLVSFL